MKCQICGRRTVNDICDSCLKFVNIDNNMKHMSNEFYNRGLKKAQERDLTGAIKELEKSIAYDKDNYYSRNLIGLCYKEIGMYGEASKNWFLSRYNEFEDNNVQKYIDEIGIELSQNKGLVKSIELYNEALEKINNKELANAYQLLVEATNKNEKLVPAYNLLILIHLIQGQKDNAIPLIDKVLEIDVRNEKAMYYYTIATKNKFRPQQNTMNRLPSVKTEVETVEVLDTKKLVGCVLLAVVVTAVVMYFALGMLNKTDGSYDELNTKYQESLNTSKEAADEYSKQLAEKDTEIATLKTEKETLESNIQSYQSGENLTEAKSLYDAKNYVDSAAKLHSIDITALSAAQQEVYNQIYETTYKKAVEQLSTSGIKDFNNGNYADSKSELLNAYLYCDQITVDNKNVAEIVYYLARDFEELGDKEQAINYYNILLERYSDYAQDSSDRIATLSQ